MRPIIIAKMNIPPTVGPGSPPPPRDGAIAKDQHASVSPLPGGTTKKGEPPPPQNPLALIPKSTAALRGPIHSQPNM